MRLIYFSKKKHPLIGGAGDGDMVALRLSPFKNNGYIMSSILNIYKTNSTDLYPQTKGYLRETWKSQNINPIYLTLSSPSVSFRS